MKAEQPSIPTRLYQLPLRLYQLHCLQTIWAALHTNHKSSNLSIARLKYLLIMTVQHTINPILVPTRLHAAAVTSIA